MKEELSQIAGLVEENLKKFLDKKIGGVSGLEKEMWEQISEFTLRPAKRIRAALVWQGYKLFGGKNEKEVIDAMMGVELIHAGLLMHDDIIDEDELRRGKETTHVYWAKKYKSEKFGRDMAICAGDVAMLAGVGLCGKVATEVAETIVTTAMGEALDSEITIKEEVTETETLRMYELKSAIYTFESPLKMGMRLAGGDNGELIQKYARPLGIAFQIKDDILGVFGDSKETGKSTDSDIKQGKKTLLRLKVEGNRIKEIYEKEKITEKEIAEIKKEMRESGALKYCEEKIDEYTKEAKEVVKKMKAEGLNEEAIKFLDELVDYVAEREK